MDRKLDSMSYNNFKPLTRKDFHCRGPWSQIYAHQHTLPSGISSSCSLLDPVCTQCRKLSLDNSKPAIVAYKFKLIKEDWSFTIVFSFSCFSLNRLFPCTRGWWASYDRERLLLLICNSRTNHGNIGNSMPIILFANSVRVLNVPRSL